VSQKNYATIHSFITLTNVGRFSQFFYCCVLPEICNKTNAILPTTYVAALPRETQNLKSNHFRLQLLQPLPKN